MLCVIVSVEEPFVNFVLCLLVLMTKSVLFNSGKS